MDIDKRILIPGWAGSLEPEEIKFVVQQLKKRPALREKWGFSRNATKYPIKKLQEGASIVRTVE